MPVPKKRTTISRRGDRRAHDKLYPTYAIICPNCAEPVLRHRLCTKCGQYRGRQVLPIKDESSDAVAS